MIPLIYKIILVLVLICLTELFVCIQTRYLGIVFTEPRYIFIIYLAAEAMYLLDAIESLAG